jgi:uncharacterized RmlC-like cupin family protein
MRLVLEYKADCVDEHCPARHRVVSEEGGYVIVGTWLGEHLDRQAGAGPGEMAVWIPADVIHGHSQEG